jgi:hypothetical protein
MRQDGVAMQRNSIELEDEQTSQERQEEAKKLLEEEKKEEEEKEAANAERDRVNELIERQVKKELKKLNKMYDPKTIIKLLRLLEMSTSIAFKNPKIRNFVLKETTPERISYLIKLLLSCQRKHGIIILKLLKNYQRLEIPGHIFDEAIEMLEENGLTKDIHPKTQFENSPFLQFCFNLLLSIRSTQWDK